MKKYIVLLLMACLSVSLIACKKEQKVYSGSVMLYSTLDNEELYAIKEAFEYTYKGVTLDYYYSSEERVKNLIETEKDTGSFQADVLFAFDLDTYKKYSKDGYFATYKSKEAGKFPADVKDKENTYVGVVKKKDEGKIVPIALLNGAISSENGKLLIDFILSKAGKEILQEKGLEVLRK